ncbi:MAG: hypothetical protein JWN24_3718 [Phycisphaerales bacterium]|nr:hypothetical protein [Phycisphaerales bacterium]
MATGIQKGNANPRKWRKEIRLSHRVCAEPMGYSRLAGSVPAEERLLIKWEVHIAPARLIAFRQLEVVGDEKLSSQARSSNRKRLDLPHVGPLHCPAKLVHLRHGHRGAR